MGGQVGDNGTALLNNREVKEGCHKITVFLLLLFSLEGMPFLLYTLRISSLPIIYPIIQMCVSARWLKCKNSCGQRNS